MNLIDSDLIAQLLSCKVCLEPYNTERKRPYLVALCGHCFCKQCLDSSWPERTCPFCRQPYLYMIEDFGLLNVVQGCINQVRFFFTYTVVGCICLVFYTYN